MILTLCILVRIVANPFSNVFQKILTGRGADPLFVICVTHGLLSVVCAPALLILPLPASAEIWLNLAICSLLAVAGNVLIVLALRHSDLSVLGPINAYKAVVSLIPGMILLGEFPKLLGMAGIALIVVGTYFLAGQEAAKPGEGTVLRFLRDRGVQYRFAALALSATEAVFLKRALLGSSPEVIFALWAILGFLVSLTAACWQFRTRGLTHELQMLRTNWLSYLSLAVTTGLMQLCTLWAFEGFQVGYALALFQTSALLQVVLGYQIFQERHFLQRLFGAAVMVAGAVLIVLERVGNPD